MQRSENLARLQEPLDVLVIGGGVAGLGAALDAASRGYRTALVDAGDFGGGASGATSKLLSGGDWLAPDGLPPAAWEERERLARNAPHLLRTTDLIAPGFGWPLLRGLGLRLQDLLASRPRAARARPVGPAELAARAGTLKPDARHGGAVRADAVVHDTRLAVTLARTADAHGAAVVNHAAVTRLLSRGGRLAGAVIEDRIGGREIEVSAHAVINSAGAAVDATRRLDDPAVVPSVTSVELTVLVLPRDFLPGDAALAIPGPTGRVLLVPWMDRVVLSSASGAPPAEGRRSEQATDLLEAAARALSIEPRPADVISASTARFARAPGGRSLSVSRSGLVTVVGGRWRNYRVIAEQAVDRAALAGSLPTSNSRTAELRLHGSPANPDEQDPTLWPYGSDARHVRALTESDPALAATIHASLPVTAAEVLWAVRQEMALTVEDVLARRTAALALDEPAALAAAPGVARLMAAEFERGAHWEEQQVEALRDKVAAGRPL
ncbi:MAG TPA: FAD-dependent oxidoreductase [Deinococcales bacterium]|nr:FAD-dependent oxidoreductase [Deinococcales bacterium]